MKVCKECKIEKEIIDFYKNRNSCKECSKKLFNEYYKKTKEKRQHIKKNITWRIQNKLEIIKNLTMTVIAKK